MTIPAIKGNTIRCYINNIIFNGILRNVENENLTIETNTPIFIENNSTIEFEIFNDEGGVIKGITVVENLKVLSKHQVFNITLPNNIEIVQRRKFFRVDNKKIIEINKLNNKELNKTCLMLDLSGGGIKIVSDDDFKEGDILLLSLPIKNKVLKVKGEIARQRDITISKEYGIKFKELSEGYLESVISEVFTIQRKNIKKMKNLQ